MYMSKWMSDLDKLNLVAVLPSFAFNDGDNPILWIRADERHNWCHAK